MQLRARSADAGPGGADIDGFKLVNDRYGHDRGDAVLRDTADEIRDRLRSFELVYRLGGDEFLVVLADHELCEGAVIAERLRAGIEQRRPGGLDITLSFGVSAAVGPAIDSDDLFALVDEALYEAKRQGRNQVCIGGVIPPAPSATGAGLAA